MVSLCGMLPASRDTTQHSTLLGTPALALSQRCILLDTRSSPVVTGLPAARYPPSLAPSHGGRSRNRWSVPFAARAPGRRARPPVITPLVPSPLPPRVVPGWPAPAGSGGAARAPGRCAAAYAGRSGSAFRSRLAPRPAPGRPAPRVKDGPPCAEGLLCQTALVSLPRPHQTHQPAPPAGPRSAPCSMDEVLAGARKVEHDDVIGAAQVEPSRCGISCHKHWSLARHRGLEFRRPQLGRDPAVQGSDEPAPRLHLSGHRPG